MEYTKYETARIIGARALQISMGAPFMIKMTDKDIEAVKYNPIEIAKLEFKEGLIPITVKRPLPVILDEKQQKAETKPENTDKQELALEDKNEE